MPIRGTGREFIHFFESGWYNISVKRLHWVLIILLVSVCALTNGVPAATTESPWISAYPDSRPIPRDPRVKADDAASFKAYGTGVPPWFLPVPIWRALVNRNLFKQPKLHEPVARIEDRKIDVPGGRIHIRIYTPEGKGPFPIMVFIHGGGWIICNLDTYDDVMRSFCRRAGIVVVGIDYRLAPKYKFPVPLEDSYAGFLWTAAHASELGADPSRLAVVGDSAGGNLAAAVVLLARDRRGPKIASQIVSYPGDSNLDTGSMHLYAAGYGLSRDLVKWSLAHYMPSAKDYDNPVAWPMKAHDLTGLPPALLQVGAYDVFRDATIGYATRLQEAGVPVHLTIYQDQGHILWLSAADHPQRDHALQEACDALVARLKQDGFGMSLKR